MKLPFLRSSFLLLLGFAAHAAASASSSSPFLGRWALTLADGRAGWLEITRDAGGGWYDGSLLWGGGSVRPLSSVVIEGDVLTVTRTREVERKDPAGEVRRKQQFTDTLTGRLDGGLLRMEWTSARPDGSGFDRTTCEGRAIPPLPPRPDVAKAKFGEPIPLFDGRSLDGWRLNESGWENGWRAENGVLVNRPAENVPGEPRRRFGNLRTTREFEDFKLTLETRVPPKGNSGVYLRGVYEVQVLDSHGRALDSHNMGAIYSRITPTASAEKPAGEWQRMEITLLDRHVTVVLNGTTIIDNQPLAGCTGGALWSDEFRPGPIFLQGDHGPIEFRNLVLRPVMR